MSALPFPAESWEPQPLPIVERARGIYLRATQGLSIPKVEVQEPADPRRRARAREDLVYATEVYWPHIYYEPSQWHYDTMRRMEEKILTKGKIIFREAEAGPRSIGKSTTRRIAAEWAGIYAHELMTLFLGAKDDKAEAHVTAIKNDLFTNDRLLLDFPEICGWARAFGNDPKRCPPGFDWLDNLCKLPNFCYFLAAGLGSSIPGTHADSIRPGLIILDDVESVESVHSDTLTKKIGKQIDQEALRLHDMNRRAYYILLGTVRTKNCNVARYTDPQQSPGWQGNRFKGLIAPPAAEDKWSNFVAICKREMPAPAEALAIADAEVCRITGYKLELFGKIENVGFQNALRYYACHKLAMDAGAELLDPIRLPLYECYRCIAEESQMTFSTEIQNEPWEDDDKVLDKREWDYRFIASHASDYDVGALPADCPAEFVTCFADVHASAIYYSFRAWAPDGTSWGIEHGVSEVYLHNDADKVERYKALVNAMLRLHEVAQQGFKCGARTLGLRLGLADEGWEPDLVREFCRRTRGLFRPTKGFSGMGKPRLQKSKESPFSINVGVDHFKHDLARLLDRTRGEPGFFHLHREPKLSYCQHMCAEEWRPKANKEGTDVNEWEWFTKNRNNHWWDTEVGNCVAAWLAGLRFASQTVAPKPGPPAHRPSGMGEPQKASWGGYRKSGEGGGSNWKIGR